MSGGLCPRTHFPDNNIMLSEITHTSLIVAPIVPSLFHRTLTLFIIVLKGKNLE